MFTLLFYLMVLPFVFNEIYYVYNKKELDKSFKDKGRNISSLSKLEMSYYVFRFLYWIWLGVGLFSSMYLFFIILLILRFLQIPLYHVNRKLYIIWDNLLPTISIIFMLVITIYKIIG